MMSYERRYIPPDEPRYIPPRRLAVGEIFLIATMVVGFIGLAVVVVPLIPPVTGL
jgi:hypothetical protein